MRFVKRVSLFFLYSAFMLAVGFCLSFFMQEYFYPGSEQPEIGLPEVGPEAELPVREVVSAGDAIMSADTEYIVLSLDVLSGEESETEEMPPDKFIGLTREKLEAEIGEYDKSPSLSDLEKGFTHMELLSFSPSRVVVRKSYKKEDGFFLLNENHYVVVYDKNLTHVYMNTGISTKMLPEEVQDEILRMKYIENESELYHFLESYSS